MNRNFDEFTDFESLRLEVPTFCFFTGCVSAHRDRRYVASHADGWIFLVIVYVFTLPLRSWPRRNREAIGSEMRCTYRQALFVCYV
jgi:hypothetical protein